MRIGFESFGHRGHAHPFQRIVRTCQRLRIAHGFMGLQGFDHLGVNAQHRIERHHGILEHHGDVASPQGAQL